jgi:hypothetical protein
MQKVVNNKGLHKYEIGYNSNAERGEVAHGSTWFEVVNVECE